jgi:hypothetical protein
LWNLWKNNDSLFYWQKKIVQHLLWDNIQDGEIFELHKQSKYIYNLNDII